MKEMRLRGIDGMAAGNAYLPEFMADFNGRFAVAPRDPADAHRKVLHETRELDLIFSEHHVRKLTKEPFDPIRVPRVPGDGAGPGLPASRRGGHGVRGVRWVGDGAARRPGVARSAARRDRGGGSGGGRKDDSGAGGPGQGGTAIAPGLQAGAGSPLAAAIEAASERGRRRMKADATPLPMFGRRRSKGTFLLWRKGDISTLR